MMKSNEIEMKQGYLLSMDTSTSNMTIALLSGGQVVQEHETEAVRNHSVQLLPNIKSMLTSEGIKPKDLAAIAIGQGPGSYTGVRIGVTAGKTLAWSLGIPLIGISSLEAMAHSGYRQVIQSQNTGNLTINVESGTVKDKVRYIIPLMDARRSQAFTGIYECREDQTWNCLKQDGIRVISAWLEELSVMLNHNSTSANGAGLPDEIIFVGETELFTDAIKSFADEWSDRMGSGAVYSSSSHIKAADVGYLANKLWNEDTFKSDDFYDFVPNYTRLAEAEANLLKAAQERE